MTRALALAAAAALVGCGGGRRPRDAAPAPAAEEAARDAAPAPIPPLDPARLDRLAAVEVPGFRVDGRDRTPTSLVVALHADAVAALVTIAPCLACRPPDPARWQDALPELRQLMPGALEDDPSTTFELAAATVAGHPCVATWELGALDYPDEVVASHAARLYCNDGVTELVVRVDDEAVARAHSAAAARAAAHRDAVEGAARTLAAAYLAP